MSRVGQVHLVSEERSRLDTIKRLQTRGRQSPSRRPRDRGVSMTSTGHGTAFRPPAEMSPYERKTWTVLRRLAETREKRRILKAVPVAGAAVGAGMYATAPAKISKDAEPADRCEDAKSADQLQSPSTRARTTRQSHRDHCGWLACPHRWNDRIPPGAPPGSELGPHGSDLPALMPSTDSVHIRSVHVCTSLLASRCRRDRDHNPTHHGEAPSQPSRSPAEEPHCQSPTDGLFAGATSRRTGANSRTTGLLCVAPRRGANSSGRRGRLTPSQSPLVAPSANRCSNFRE